MKNLLKVIMAGMIIAIFTTSSLFQPIASASAAANNTEIILDTNYETEVIKVNPEIEFTTQDSLPPRQPAKDPFWIAFTVAMASIVGMTTAQTLTANAVNNGIDWACDKYDKYTGVKQLCKIFN